MAKIVINLRSKWFFWITSFLTLSYLPFHLNMIVDSVDIHAFDVFTMFLLMLFAVSMWFVPIQFNDMFV